MESRQRREVGQIVHRNHLVQEVAVPPGSPLAEAHFKGAREPLGLGVQAPLHLWAKVNFYPNLGTFRPTFMTFKARLLVVLGHLELSLQPLQQPRLVAIASREINEGVFWVLILFMARWVCQISLDLAQQQQPRKRPQIASYRIMESRMRTFPTFLFHWTLLLKLSKRTQTMKK